MAGKIEFQNVASGNVHSRGHVVRFSLPDGSADLPGARLRALLESIGEVHCRFALPAQPLSPEHSADSLPAGRAVCALAIALQRHCGCDVRGCGWAGKTSRNGGNWWAECLRFDIGRRAAQLANSLAVKARDPDGATPAAAEKAVERLLETIYDKGPVNQWHLLRTARALGLRYRPYSGSSKISQIGLGAGSELYFVSVPERESYVHNLIQHNKSATAQVLAFAGLSVPVHHLINSETDACAAAADIGYPVVIKPMAGERQTGVEINLRDEAELRAAIARQALAGSLFLVERFFEGKNYRLMSAKGKLVSAYEVPPSAVTGDGGTTLRGLIEQLNRQPTRGIGHRFAGAPVDIAKLEQAAKSPMRDRGYTLDTVPAAGEEVPISYFGGRSHGNSIELVTPRVHPDFAEILERIFAFVSIPICGVDLIAKDISAPATPENYLINEINSRPALSVFNIAAPGEPDLFDMFRMVIGEADNLRVPVILVVSDSADTKDGPGGGGLSLAIADALGGNYRVALANSSGYRIGARWLSTDPHHTLSGSDRAFADRQAEAIVIERAPRELAAAGLGVNQIDAVVFAPEPGGGPSRFFNYSRFAEYLCRRAAIYVDTVGTPRRAEARKPGRLTVWTGAAGAVPALSLAETDHFAASDLPGGKWRLKDFANQTDGAWPLTGGTAKLPAEAIAAFIADLFKPN